MSKICMLILLIKIVFLTLEYLVDAQIYLADIRLKEE